ncbi:MAG: GAF domain-containing protein [Chloroflexi bacterium]|nr:GAF domain-containing protein [Chloroflexota bacterium]MCL5274760.1 GAF domain-containing protein [Chloroflexota bacterium]
MNDEPVRGHIPLEPLERLLLAIEASGRAVLPGASRALLQSIVDAAARIFGAAAASIALVDEERQELEFKVSYGAGNESVVGRCIPVDSGIAGYVVMTAQPMAISDVKQDARFNQSFAQSTGYVPRSILAAPLFSGDRVLGVMEVLDKIDASSFGIRDIELLEMFARQAAIAIDQSQQVERLDEALIAGLQQAAATGEVRLDAVTHALGEDGDAARRQDMLALAGLFYDISALGDAERRACIRVLETFREYARATTNLL